MRFLLICGAIAAGEFIASGLPTYAETWPAFALLAGFVCLFGYGLSVRGWALPCCCLVGMALFFAASVGRETMFREKPWMRNCPQRVLSDKDDGGSLLPRIRSEMERRVALGLTYDREVVGLNRAILLGDRRGVPGRLKRAFVDSGTMHVFAISGLHVLAVAQMLMLILSVLMVPRRWVGVLAVPLLWGYVAVIGGAPSAVRAAAMASFYYGAPVFWRRPDGLRAWELTFLIVYVGNPLMIESVGCALSFVVMLAILLTASWARRFGKVKSALILAVVIWAVGVPISAHVFGRLTLGGLLANLVMVSAAVCMVKAAALGLAVSLVSETLTIHLNNLSALLTRGMVVLAEIVSQLPGGNFEIRRWTLCECFGWYSVFVLVGVLAHRHRKMI